MHTDIYFDFKSTRLRADAARLLARQGRSDGAASTWGVLIQGCADSQGRLEYNRPLAQRRAESVKQFLVEPEVLETTIKVVTIGKEGALCDDPRASASSSTVASIWRSQQMVRAAAAPVRSEIAVGDALETSPAMAESGRP